MINKNSQKKSFFGVVLTIAILAPILLVAGGRFFLGPVKTAKAAPPAQIPIYTPTPGPDGRIIYIVKPNDTLLSISLITGIPVEKLRSLNNLSGDMIFEGQKLLLGMGGPAEVTVVAGPTLTPTPVLPTPSPKPGKGTLCIILFDDLNGDSRRDENEPSIPGGALSFNNRSGSVSQSITTGAGLAPQCFKDLPEGDYTISVAAPKGYNSTTDTSYELTLKAGSETYVNFGAQENSQTLANGPVIPATEGRRSPILGIVGGLFLLVGVGVAVFAGRMLRTGR